LVKNFKRGRRATLNLARHLAVQGPARREAEKSVEDNLAPINLQLRRPPVQVRAKREAEKSADNLALINLQLRRLPVQVRAKREAEKSADNLALINLQLRRLPVQVRAKREADEREGRTSMVDLAASQRVERKLRLSAFRDNRSVERKRERGLQRRGHNYLVNFRGGSRAKVPEPLL